MRVPLKWCIVDGGEGVWGVQRAPSRVRCGEVEAGSLKQIVIARTLQGVNCCGVEVENLAC